MQRDRSFFETGFYKKPVACPRIFDIDGKWNIDRSVDACNMPVSVKKPVLVEEKFNGNRGIFEYRDGHGCLKSDKHGCHDNGFPAKVARLLESQFSVANTTNDDIIDVVGVDDAMELKGLAGPRIDDVIIDGEMYLADCNGKIPGLATQSKAIKGTHPDLEKNCIFSYKVFDIIQLNGKDVTGLPFSRRKELLSDVLPYTIMDSGEGISVERVKGMKATSTREIADAVKKIVDNGHEGIVVKIPSSKYAWKGRDENRPDTDGWWKIKNSSTVDATVTRACLGNPGKTGLNAFRYKVLSLAACKDVTCKEFTTITDKGVAHSATGGEFSGNAAWDRNVHDVVLRSLVDGTGKTGKEWRLVTKSLIGKKMSPGYDRLIGGMSKHGKTGLPRCVAMEPGKFNVTVAGLEFNINKNGTPKINGPPVLVRRATRMDTIDGILRLPSTHV
jgi:hypothetical protein